MDGINRDRSGNILRHYTNPIFSFNNSPARDNNPRTAAKKIFDQTPSFIFTILLLIIHE